MLVVQNMKFLDTGCQLVNLVAENNGTQTLEWLNRKLIN